MPTKSLEEQLADLEDAERRLRPLVQEARGAVQDLRAACRQAEEIVKHAAEAALKAEMGKLIEKEMRDIVPDIANFKRKLNEELKEIVEPVLSLLDEVKDRYGRVAAQYDRLEQEMARQGYERTGLKEIQLPVPANSKAGQQERRRKR